MRWIGTATSSQGVTEALFVEDRAGRAVPGVLWLPDEAQGERPLVLIGHGASGHKREDYVLALARRLVRHLGFAAAAIDGPIHGDRRTDSPGERTAVLADFDRIWRDDPTMTDEMVDDWRAVLASLQGVGGVGGGPVGWWGLSMGTILGLPLVATESRVRAAVLGLAGVIGPTRQRLADDAARVSCPVLMLMQWDDELFPRHTVLELFGALASSDKRLHASPGLHTDVPPEEFDQTEIFLSARLGG